MPQSEGEAMSTSEKPPTTGGGCCAHLGISYRTRETSPGLVSGWWECDSDCGTRFVPNYLRAASEQEKRDMGRTFPVEQEGTAELRLALARLANEVMGSAEMARECIGNTNTHCLIQRATEARTLLAALSISTERDVGKVLHEGWAMVFGHEQGDDCYALDLFDTEDKAWNAAAAESGTYVTRVRVVALPEVDAND